MCNPCAILILCHLRMTCVNLETSHLYMSDRHLLYAYTSGYRQLISSNPTSSNTEPQPTSRLYSCATRCHAFAVRHSDIFICARHLYVAQKVWRGATQRRQRIKMSRCGTSLFVRDIFMAHKRCHVANSKSSRHAYEWVMSHIGMRHASRIRVPCHT